MTPGYGAAVGGKLAASLQEVVIGIARGAGVGTVVAFAFMLAICNVSGWQPL